MTVMPFASRTFIHYPGTEHRKGRRNALLPLKQTLVLAFIDAELKRIRRFPSAREIATHMGWVNDVAARDCLSRLVGKGFVRRNAQGKWERV